MEDTSLHSQEVPKLIIKTFKKNPGQFSPLVGASALRPMGHGFDYQSRAYTWVAGSIPSLGGERRDNQSNVCLTIMSQCLSLPLSLFSLPLSLSISLKINGKILSGED